MTTIYDVRIGQRVSFEVYPAAVLGNNFKDVRLEGIISARTAASYGMDIQALHANVYPTLPRVRFPTTRFNTITCGSNSHPVNTRCWGCRGCVPTPL